MKVKKNLAKWFLSAGIPVLMASSFCALFIPWYGDYTFNPGNLVSTSNYNAATNCVTSAGISGQRTLNFTEVTMTKREKTFSDTACQTPHMTVGLQFDYTVGNELQANTYENGAVTATQINAKEITMTLSAELLTCHSSACLATYTASLSNTGYPECDALQISLDTEVDILPCQLAIFSGSAGAGWNGYRDPWEDIFYYDLQNQRYYLSTDYAQPSDNQTDGLFNRQSVAERPHYIDYNSWYEKIM